MTTAAEHYAAVHDTAVTTNRFTDHRMPGDHWSDIAELFRLDPRRPWEQNLTSIARYLKPSDRFLDIGGGAGRVSLALAGQVLEVVLVEPSDSMREQFIGARDEAGITNARIVSDWWMDSAEAGEIVHIADVSYFVRDIVPFITKLHDAASRRVIISVWQPTPGDMDATLRRVVLGEEPARWPGLPELAAVLWEMGLLPEILPVPEPPWWIPEIAGGLTEREAIDFAMYRLGQDDAATREQVASKLDRVFQRTPGGLEPTWFKDPREVLITWETGGRPLG